MRILWLIGSEHPFVGSKDFSVLAEYCMESDVFDSSTPALAALEKNDYEIVVILESISGSMEFLQKLKRSESWKQIPVILVSNSWDKEQFKNHSQTNVPAQSYAKFPMPLKGFLHAVKKLSGKDTAQLMRMPKSTTANESKAVKHIDRSTSLSKDESENFSEDPLSVLSEQPALNSIEDVKKFLNFREEELAVALVENQQLRIERNKLNDETKALRNEIRELEHLKSEAEERSENLSQQEKDLNRKIEEEREKLEFEQNSLQEKIGYLEKALSKSGENYNNLKERVRKDIRKIQTREKELEKRLELVKKDSETLISERDKYVLELHRKIDSLEFNIDQLQDVRIKAQTKVNDYMDKMSRLSRTLDLAVGMLEQEEEEDIIEETEVVKGGAMADESLLKADPKIEESSSSGPEGELDAANELLEGVEGVDDESFDSAENVLDGLGDDLNADSDADQLLGQ